MKSLRRGIVVCVCALALLIAGASWGASRDPAGTAFTYQGRLTEGGVPVTGNYDFRFTLYDAEAGGSQVGPLMERTGVAVEDGLVTLDLDFGDVVSSSALWLEVAVRPAGSTTYTTLSPRQRLRPGPQGLWSARADEAGHASSADSATNAGHATSADSATNASHATSADSATNADHAASADSATNADHATSADSASTADDATNLGGHPASFFLDTSSTAQTKNATLSLVASSGHGIVAQGPGGGGHFWDADGSGDAEIGFGDTGVSAVGHTAGGHFADSNGSGFAWVGYGDYGIEAQGNNAGGHFRDADNSGEAWVGHGDTGIFARGNTEGAYFYDTDSSGVAHIGSGDTGIDAEGNTVGGHFRDADNSGEAWLGYGDNGIEAGGTIRGGHFFDSDSSGEAWAGSGDTGIIARGSSAGAYFYDTDSSGEAHIGSGDRGIDAFGNTAGGHFADSDGSGVAWVGYGDIGIEAKGNDEGGHFLDADNTGEAWVGYGDIGIKAVGFTAGAGFWDSSNRSDAWLADSAYGINCRGPSAGGAFDDTSDSAWAYVAEGSYKIRGNGTVSFVQNHPEDPGKVIVYAAPEGDEVAVYTRGSARLEGGEARVALGPTFRWVTDPDLGLTAYVTPREPGCTLYVPEVSTDILVVRSTEGSDCAFDYIVWGLRIGFEDSTIVQPKEQEAFIPSMKDHRRMVAEDPELARYTARSRFLEQRKAMGIEEAPDMSRARALVAAIHEFDPAVDKLPEPPELAEHEHKTAESNASSPSSRETAPVRREATSETAAAPRAVLAGGGPGQDLTARSFRSQLGRVATEVAVASPVEPGDVLAVDPERPGLLKRADSSGDPTVVGVVVETAGVTLGEGEAGEGQARALLATSAIVPCHVDAGYGAIAPGDLLVASPTPGYAMRASDSMPGSVVAKALEPAADGKRTIRVLVMLR